MQVLELNVGHDPGSAYGLMMPGRLHMLEGGKGAAAGVLQRALDVEPDNERAGSMLERAENME